MNINWTEPALDDLDSIFEFIARDAPPYAQIFVQQIIDAVARLEDFPLSGRTVPEAKQDSIREIIFQSYRVIYWIVDEQRIDIIAAIHGSRDLQDPSNQSWDVM